MPRPSKQKTHLAFGGQSKRAHLGSIMAADAILKQHFHDSIEPASSWYPVVESTSGSRSPQAIQFEFADSETDLDRISKHRRTRNVLLKLSPWAVKVIQIHYEDICCHSPAVRKEFGDLFRLAAFTPTALQYLSEREAKGIYRTPAENLEQCNSQRTIKKEAQIMYQSALEEFQYCWNLEVNQ